MTEDGATQLRRMTAEAKEMKAQGKSNSEIAAALSISESYVRSLIPAEINWGHNCLTGGIHHGRPEALWTLPLLQATVIFTHAELEQIVVARIYNDAMQYVNASPFTQKGTNNSASFSQEWADRIRDLATEKFLGDTLMRKVREITEYYETYRWRRDVMEVVERVRMDKLNPNYQPLHSHDSVNMLCRIIGQSCLFEADK